MCSLGKLENGSEGDAFTTKKTKQQHYLTLWGRGHTKCCPFPHVHTSTKLENFF